jgi:ElaB/YqjD/DUF883 family membrane-anchored ribosome-binding protein
METHFPNMHHTRSQIARERVLADLRALASHAGELLHATANDATGTANEVRSQVIAVLERAKATCLALPRQGLESAKAAARRTDETIRSHPYEATSIAFGVGILLGVIIRRRSFVHGTVSRR